VNVKGDDLLLIIIIGKRNHDLLDLGTGGGADLRELFYENVGELFYENVVVIVVILYENVVIL
jgi:hypothetical protein